MSNDIDSLRTHLFETLAGLRDGSLSVEQAKAISDVSQTIINTAKVEVDYLRVTEQPEGTGFIPAGRRQLDKPRLEAIKRNDPWSGAKVTA